MTRGLTKSRIVEAGLAVLDAGGLDGLTVRAVAARLEVQAPALYWHVRSKQDLLDEMATELWRHILADLHALPAETSWRDAMLAFANLTRRTLLAHRDGAKVFSGTYLTDPAILAQQEQRLQRMVAVGFELADVVRGWSLVYSFTIGFCIEEQAVAQAAAAGDDRYSLEKRASRLDAREHPLVLESGPKIFGDPDGRFADLLAIVIDAVARLQRPPV